MGTPPSSFSVEHKVGRRGITMLDRKIYNLMKKKYGKVASWAVWDEQLDKPKSNMGNMAWAKDEEKLCSELNPNFVFVGLNKSKRPKKKGSSEDENSNTKNPWKNFHSGNSRSHSYKLRYALKGTTFWGAYMTDLFKEVEETDSKNVVSIFKKDKAALEKQMKDFAREISHLGGKPVLVALGNATYDFLMPLKDKYPAIEKLPHYSYSRISKEQYRDKVREMLKTYRGGAKK